jgi:large repetitive protein
VTIFDEANHPMMNTIEAKVYGAVRKGEVVRYEVTPLYEGSETILYALSVVAQGNRGFSLAELIANVGRK